MKPRMRNIIICNKKFKTYFKSREYKLKTYNVVYFGFYHVEFANAIIILVLGFFQNFQME